MAALNGGAGGDLLVTGISRLLTMADGVHTDAAVWVRNGRVAYAGPRRGLVLEGPLPAELDVAGAAVVPGFVDAHTHLVYAGVRREEFLARLAGQRYDGGGIAATVAATRAATDAQLGDLLAARLAAAVARGTTTVEVKTGYGLSAAQELRLLRLVVAAGQASPAHVEATYLGAHVVPPGVDRGAYLEEVIATLPAAAAAGATWVDVFCDEGVFSVDEARTVLLAGRTAGLGLRLHAEEIAASGGAALAAELGCASADHLEHVSEADAAALAAAGVVAVLLPTVTLTLRSGQWGHARRLRDAGVQLALATDTNPGTSWCESMPTAIRLACLEMGLRVDEAFAAATAGGAAALRLPDAGRLAPGFRGDLAVLDAEHEADVVAHLGSAGVAATVIAGRVVARGAG